MKKLILTILFILMTALATAGNVYETLDAMKNVCDGTKMLNGNTYIASTFQDNFRDVGLPGSVYVRQSDDTLIILMESSMFDQITRDNYVEVTDSLKGMTSSIAGLEAINQVMVFLRVTGKGTPKILIKDGEAIYLN